jgi:NTP pyrophosphatase (non-canonical NTP hydrolase)
MTKDSSENLTKRIKNFAEERNWGQFHDPKNIALSLVLEATEVLELFQWTKDNQLQKGKEKELAEELADVYYWVLMLSDKYGIDINKSLDKKMLKNEKKYPVSKAKNSSKKYTEL